MGFKPVFLTYKGMFSRIFPKDQSIRLNSYFFHQLLNFKGLPLLSYSPT